MHGIACINVQSVLLTVNKKYAIMLASVYTSKHTFQDNVALPRNLFHELG